MQRRRRRADLSDNLDRVLRLLFLRGPLTRAQVIEALSLPSARVHLLTLMQDGLVVRAGEIHTGHRPQLLYKVKESSRK